MIQEGLNWATILPDGHHKFLYHICEKKLLIHEELKRGNCDR